VIYFTFIIMVEVCLECDLLKIAVLYAASI